MLTLENQDCQKGDVFLVNERKLKILAAVVEEYVRTGEPVGSKAIASLPDIGVSAATVRNDMAMLEQLGYLEQPHTSAGRVPTISGYPHFRIRSANGSTICSGHRGLSQRSC